MSRSSFFRARRAIRAALPRTATFTNTSAGILDAFGPQRCFWGTDITRMPCSYRQCVTRFTEELPWLQGCDKELMMGDAICDWLGWKRPA